MSTEPQPDGIMQLAHAYWGSKTLLSAVELGLFTLLAEGPKNHDEIAASLELHPCSSRDFLDALVALGMLSRPNGLYTNTPETDRFLDRAKPSYVGGMLELSSNRLYGFWGSLTEALRTGKPQNETKQGEDLFTALYADPDRLEGFLQAMTGISMSTAGAMARKFPWDKYQTFIDVGAAQGCLPVAVAGAHPHLTGGGFDLPAVGPIFEDYVAQAGMADRLRFYPGSFFDDPLPTADVLIMGHILHDWDLDEKVMLLAKARDALPDGGALIVYENLIDDDRTTNVFGLLMSLNMLIETQGGFDFTGADCSEWMRTAGFSEIRVEHLTGPAHMVIGIK